MNSILDTRITRHTKRDNSVLIILGHLLVHGDVVDVLLHIDGVGDGREEDGGEDSEPEGPEISPVKGGKTQERRSGLDRLRRWWKRAKL